jgi:hypothetical protein
MSRQRFRDVIRFARGFILSRPKIDADTNYAADGSHNVIFMGQAKPRPFKGMESQGGIGGIYGTPAGAFTDKTPGFALDDIEWAFTICAGGNPSIADVADGEALITNTNVAQSQDAFTASPFTVTTNATLRFRFTRLPATTGGSAIVALRYTTISDCALIQDSATDRGFECYLSNSGPIVAFGSRNPGEAWVEDFSESFTDTDTVYEIRINSGVVTFWKDSVLQATSTYEANGDPLGLFIRVDGQSTPDRNAQVALQVFANT